MITLHYKLTFGKEDKPISLKGIGNRVVRRLVLGSWAKNYGMDKYRPLEPYPYLFKAGYKYSSLDCYSSLVDQDRYAD